MSSDKKPSDDDNEELELRDKLKSLDLTEEQRQWIESMLEEDEGSGEKK